MQVLLSSSDAAAPKLRRDEDPGPKPKLSICEAMDARRVEEQGESSDGLQNDGGDSGTENEEYALEDGPW